MEIKVEAGKTYWLEGTCVNGREVTIDRVGRKFAFSKPNGYYRELKFDKNTGELVDALMSGQLYQSKQDYLDEMKIWNDAVEAQKQVFERLRKMTYNKASLEKFNRILEILNEED